MTDSSKNVRVRVAGILIENGRVLLISHKKEDDIYWLLPGGGVDFGESLEEALAREFFEELNISIKTHNLAFVCDSIDPHGGRHILNIIFYCSYTEGVYSVGREKRLLGYEFYSYDELAGLKLFPPINNELISVLKNESNSIYIGKMWLMK